METDVSKIKFEGKAGATVSVPIAVSIVEVLNGTKLIEPPPVLIILFAMYVESVVDQ